MAAFAGPLVVGAIWRGVTKAGAYSGLVTGLATFALLHTQAIDPNWLEPGTLRNILAWLHAEGPNPFSCAAIGEFVSITATFFVSKATRPLDANHVREIFEGT